MAGYTRVGGSAPSVLTPPAALGFAPPFALTRVAGVVLALYQRDQWRIPGTAVIWVSLSRGNDTTGDGGYATPYKSLGKARSVVAANGTTVYAEPGIYDRRYNWSTGAQTAFDANLIGVGGRVVSSAAWEGGTWAATGTGCYSTARSSAANVVDKSWMDARGVGRQLAVVATQALCEATPGSWAQVGGTLYVNTFDARAPDSSVVVYLVVLNGQLNAGNKLYVQGVEFEGGSDAFNCGASVTASSRLVFDSCGFTYSVGNGLAAAGVPLCISVNCYSYGNLGDCYNYHHGSNGINVNFVELDCSGYSCGWPDGVNNDNVSTAHEGCLGIRIRTIGGNNYGPTYADVGASKTWNIDCIGFGSAVPSSDANAATKAVTFGAYDTAVQWFENSVSRDSVTSTYKTAGAAQYQRNCDFVPASAVPSY